MALTSMATGLPSQKGRKVCPLHLPDTSVPLSDSLTRASAHSPAGPSTERAAQGPFPNPRGRKTPFAGVHRRALGAASSQPRQGCKKRQLPLPSKTTLISYSGQGKGGYPCQRCPRGHTYCRRGDRQTPPLPGDFRVCCKCLGPRCCDQPDSIGAVPYPWVGGAGGEKKGKRKAEGWAVGPHPARPGGGLVG